MNLPAEKKNRQSSNHHKQVTSYYCMFDLRITRENPSTCKLFCCGYKIQQITNKARRIICLSRFFPLSLFIGLRNSTHSGKRQEEPHRRRPKSKEQYNPKPHTNLCNHKRILFASPCHPFRPCIRTTFGHIENAHGESYQ